MSTTPVWVSVVLAIGVIYCALGLFGNGWSSGRNYTGLRTNASDLWALAHGILLIAIIVLIVALR